MREPILHLTETKDSLDIMLEMNMDSLLKHPVIVEVLNLANEGKYSADSSPLTLSPTFTAFFSLKTFDMVSIHERLAANIQSIGKKTDGSSNQKKSTLQFNIWRQSVYQRQLDEMYLTVLFSVLVLFLIWFLNLIVLKIFKQSNMLGANLEAGIDIIDHIE